MQKTVFENIFFIENGKVRVCRFLRGKKSFEYVKRDGQISYPITEDFWTWWKNALDYVKDMDKVDFCFIYDEVNGIFQDESLKKHELSRVEEESCWNRENVQLFFEEMVEYTQIELHMADEKVVEFKKEKQLFRENLNKKRKYYTNIRFVQEDTLDTDANQVKKLVDKDKREEKEASTFIQYFRERKRRDTEE